MVVAFILSGLVNTGSAVTIQDIVDEVSLNSYSNLHSTLFVEIGDSRGYTTSGSPRVPDDEHDQARDQIFTHFQDLGFDVWLDPFTYTRDGSIAYSGCNNVVAIKPGEGGTNYVIVGAHYDTVDASLETGTFFPGADDNASGVAALLETARIANNYTFRETIIFIAFDSEETGSFGAHHFVDNHTTQSLAATNSTTFYNPAIKSMLSVDTIAWGSDNKLGVFGVSSDTNTLLHQQIGAVATQYTTLVTVNQGEISVSDHEPFHLAGIDAILLSENGILSNPHRDTPTDAVDTPSYLSFPFAVENTKLILGFLCEQAYVVPPATLIPDVTAGSITLSWTSTPGIAYSVFNTDSLTGSNGWNFLELIEQTNVQTVFQFQTNTTANTEFYQVESL